LSGEEANGLLEEYWPIYNRKFAVPARGKGDPHRSLPKGLKADNILCVKADTIQESLPDQNFENRTFLLWLDIPVFVD
jgi:hypothetical protein